MRRLHNKSSRVYPKRLESGKLDDIAQSFCRAIEWFESKTSEASLLKDVQTLRVDLQTSLMTVVGAAGRERDWFHEFVRHVEQRKIGSKFPYINPFLQHLQGL